VEEKMKKVLIFSGYYWPSTKAGGPIKSIKNILENLENIHDFFIIASDRDLHDKSPFKQIEVDKWIESNTSKIFYTNMQQLNKKKIKSILLNTNPDIIYLNSFFDFHNSIKILLYIKTLKRENIRLIVAPRGQFFKNAIMRGYIKKRLYIFLSKVFNIYDNIIWHATTNEEKKSIEDLFNTEKIVVAQNFPSKNNKTNNKKALSKNIGEIKIAYLARIHPIKNLEKTLRILKKIKGKVDFNIYGPIEDKKYWSKCEIKIKELPKNISVKYSGIIDNSLVNKIYLEHHISILLTKSENFGHSIFESIQAGCPVVISNNTPWNDLEENSVGFSNDLNNEKMIISNLQYFVNIDQVGYDFHVQKCFQYSKNFTENPELLKVYINLFND
jgi:glycosyltransferase involved in cell wall biosynthesis